MISIQRRMVSSNRLKSVGWESDILEVEFKDGAIYQYYGVSASAYRNFINSTSLGSALSKLDKFHRYKRV